MNTPQHLNTTVKGSVGMVQDAAHKLRIAAQGADRADDAHHSARDTAHQDWQGNACYAFLGELKPHLDVTRDLKVTCEAYGRAFDDLGGALEVVNNDMHEVRSTALAGGLRMEGPIVLRPEHPGSAPSAARHAGDPGGFGSAAREHQAAVDDFNDKAGVFNTCLTIFVEARKKEEQAHTEFWQAVDAGQGFDVDAAWSIGTTTVSAALGGLAGMHNARTDLETKIQALEPDSKAYQKLASGSTTLSGLTPKERLQVMGNLARSKGSEVNYRRQIQQLNQVSKYVPEGLQQAAAANAGKYMPNTKLGQQLARAFNRLPWAGSTVTAFNEFRGAATGEQTWGKAVADTVGNLGGGAAGGVAGGVLCAPVLPPWGSIGCGVGGALLGGFGGGKVADFVVPEQTDMPEPVDKIVRDPSPQLPPGSR